MANNLEIKDANNITKTIHTVEDSTSAHYNMSIPITTSGGLMFTSAIPGIVCVAGTQLVSVDNLVAVSINGPLPAGTNLLGKVSVQGIADVSIQDNASVSVRGGVLGAVSLGGGSAHIGRVSVFNDATPQTVSVVNQINVSLGGIINVSISPTQGNIPVSIGVIPTHAVTQSGSWVVSVADKVSVAGQVSVDNLVAVSVNGTVPVVQSGVWNVNASVVGRVSVFNDATPMNVSVQDNAPVSVRGGVLGAVSLGGGSAHIGRVSVFVDQVPFNVSVNNTLPIPVSVVGGRVSISGISQVSVAGAVTVAPLTNTGAAVPAGAFYVGGTDGTNLRGFLTDTAGATVITSIKDDVSIAPQFLTVYVCNTAPGGGGGSPQVSIGGTVSTQAGQIAWTDGTNARTPLTNTTGNPLVHVCNALDIGTVTVSVVVPMVSVGGAVSTQAIQIAGRDENNNARTPLVDSMGALRATGFKKTSQYIFTRPTDTVAYATGDLIANSTVAGTVVPLSFNVGRLNSGVNSIRIRRARVFKSIAGTANTAAVRLHIFDVASGVSVTGGDNAALGCAPVSAYCGYMDFAAAALVTTAFRANNAAGALVAMWQTQTFNAGTEMNIALASGQVSISGLLEARGAHTPSSGDVWTTIIEFEQD